MSSREEFEKWAKKVGYRVVLDDNGLYDTPSTIFVWEGWKAATKRAEEICQTEMDEQHLNFDAWHAAQSCRDAIRKGSNDSC